MATTSDPVSRIETALSALSVESLNEAIRWLREQQADVEAKLARLQAIKLFLADTACEEAKPAPSVPPGTCTGILRSKAELKERALKESLATAKDEGAVPMNPGTGEIGWALGKGVVVDVTKKHDRNPPGGRNEFMGTNLRDEEKAAGLHVPVTLPSSKRNAPTVTKALQTEPDPEPVEGRAMQGLKSRLWHFLDRAGPSKVASILANFPEIRQDVIMQALESGNGFVFDRQKIRWDLKCRVEAALKAKENE